MNQKLHKEYPEYHDPGYTKEHKCSDCGEWTLEDELYRWSTGQYICWDCICFFAEDDEMNPQDYIQINKIRAL